MNDAGPVVSADEVIEQLRAHNAAGNYREALRLQMELEAREDGTPAKRLAEREIQIAVAMQHAGFYLLSYNSYLSARLIATESGEMDGKLAARIDTQLAVLDERLGRYRQAQSRLSSLRPPEPDSTCHVAAMTDADWYFVTFAKALIATDSTAMARAHLESWDTHSRHSSDWHEVFRVVLRAQRRGRIGGSSLDTLEEVLTRYHEYDRPGAPWIPLFAGEHLRSVDPGIAADMLERGLETAQRLGKYFLVAAIYEQLAHCYGSIPGRGDESLLAFHRAINGFGRCQLLTHREIRARLGRLGVRLGLDPAAVAGAALRSSSVLLDRGEIRFGQLLLSRAQRRESTAAREFEVFLEEWAPLRFPGRLVALPTGETAADVLLVRTVGGVRFGTAIQAKHYLRPRQAIPDHNPRLRELGERHDVTIDRYVFVVSTSAAGGWRDAMWHAQDSERVRNVVADRTVGVTVVTEPELQTDVVLSDRLLQWLAQ